MKNFTTIRTALVFFSILTINTVSATVGGEKVLYDAVYNYRDESVYYTKQDFGGRGCPPELLKLSLNSGESTVVYSCDTGESLPHEKVESAIRTITENFKPLTPINLKSNSIVIDIRFVRNENYSFEINELYRRHFTATIYQNGKKLKDITITGCNLDQPFVFQGYSIPGFNKKIILLLSTKGDCNEGGYIDETIHVLGDLDTINKTEIANFYKGPSALKLNEGSLVVYEADTISIANEVGTTTVSSSTGIEKEIPKSSLWKKFLAWVTSLF
jgi:hypothetical protein